MRRGLGTPSVCVGVRRTHEERAGGDEYLRHTVARRATQIGVGGRSFRADRCWLATGTTPDVRSDPALEPHVDRHLDGVPVVRPDLRVGGAPLHVAGRLATIELGPAAGNLWGARMAARRITQTLTGVDLDADAVATIAPPAGTNGSETQ